MPYDFRLCCCPIYIHITRVLGEDIHKEKMENMFSSPGGPSGIERRQKPIRGSWILKDYETANISRRNPISQLMIRPQNGINLNAKILIRLKLNTALILRNTSDLNFISSFHLKKIHDEKGNIGKFLEHRHSPLGPPLPLKHQWLEHIGRADIFFRSPFISIFRKEEEKKRKPGAAAQPLSFYSIHK